MPKTNAKYRMPTHAKNQMLKKCKHDLSSNQHTEKVMKYKKKTKEKVNMLQRPSSLKQMNFKMECFSSLLVTINTEVTELKVNLKLTNLCRLDEWQLSATR